MTQFSYSEDGQGGRINVDQLQFLTQLASNSATLADGGTYCLLRIGSHDGNYRPAETVYVLDVEMMASVISVLCTQAVRNGHGPELLRRLATDLDKLRQARTRLN